MANKTGKGGFKKGQSGNPKGRPSRKTEEAYLNVMIGAVSLESWKRITKTAVKFAEAGDDKSRRWLSDYVLGKPEQPISGDLNGNIEIVIKYADD